MRLRTTITTIAISGLIAFSAGCGASYQTNLGAGAGGGDVEKAQELMAKANEIWPERVDIEKAKQAAELYGQAAEAAPGYYDAQASAAHAYYWLADSFFNDEDDDAQMDQKKYHLLGIKYGEKGLNTNEAFRKKIESGADYDEAAKLLTKEQIDCMYWFGSNLGKWALTEGLMTVLANKSKIKGVYEQVQKLDEKHGLNFFYGAPYRSLGVVYAKAPGFAGGDPDISKEMFTKAVEIAPNYFGTRVLMAQFLATKIQDKEMFKTHLQYVIDTPADVDPDLVPENTVEKGKAEALMAKIDELFAQ